jgi:probable phosphomutase (TIGR03848 family)
MTADDATPPPARARARARRPTTIVFVRHGTTPTTGQVLPGRAPALHLAEKGRAEADAAAAAIGALRAVAAVYASPLARARETAAPIAARLELPVRIDHGLSECDFGAWTGQRLDALRRKPEWRRVQRFPSGFRFPGGESFPEMQARVVAAVERMVSRHPGEVVVAVSHADPIKAAVAHALGTHLDLFQRIAVSPGSLSAVAYGPDGPTVLCVNTPAAGATAALQGPR